MCSAAEPIPICNQYAYSHYIHFLTMNITFYLLVVVALYLDSSYEPSCLSQGCFLAMYCNWRGGAITGVYNINNSITAKKQLNFANARGSLLE
jgi:hypothetical protein